MSAYWLLLVMWVWLSGVTSSVCRAPAPPPSDDAATTAPICRRHTKTITQRSQQIPVVFVCKYVIPKMQNRNSQQIVGHYGRQSSMRAGTGAPSVPSSANPLLSCSHQVPTIYSISWFTHSPCLGSCLHPAPL